MARRRLIPALALCLLLCGCSLSRHIVAITPPAQPPLQELDKHLDYVDPDEGRPTYVVPGK